MTRPDDDDFGLDAFFEAGRAAAPRPTDALMARILADAEAVQAAQAAPGPSGTARRLGLAAAFLAALGGWPAVAGLATAAVVGVWFGVAAPDTVAALAGYSSAEPATDSGYDVGDLGLAGLVLAGDL